MNDANTNLIDIAILVDAETMSSTLLAGNLKQPTVVPAPLIYMVARKDQVVFGQASKELKITAQTGDIIRWHTTSLSFNDDYQVLLYEYHVLRGAPLLSEPVPLIIDAKMPLPNAAKPLQPGVQERKYHFWQATVLEPGEVTYAFNMMVLDSASKPLGYYYWDPFIAITA
ncbi:MAG: hypothetical protein Tsb002_15700 [Wenzhouxiangellaceae bacterium]